MSGRDRRPTIHAAAAFLRDEGRIVLVLEAARGDTPSWSLPGGVLEDGELVTEGVVREVLEETGLDVNGVKRLAFVAQVDNRHPGRHRDELANEYLLTVWTLEVESWSGTLEPRDPDGVVLDVRSVPSSEAIAKVEASGRHQLTVAYLRGQLEPGSLHLL